MASKKGKKSKKRGKGTTKPEGASEQNTRKPEEAVDDDASEQEDDQDASAEDEEREATSDEEGETSEGDHDPAEAKGKKRKQEPSKKASTGPVGKSTGVLALFDHPDTTLQAARRARDKGFERWDVYTPFPVHGMDDAMGLGRSPVPWITFVMGVVGFCTAIIIQFGTMVYSWPLNYGGKPYAAWPSFVPITFEMTVLAAGVSTAVGALFLGGVLKFRKRKAHPHVTSHRFAIFVEASDPKYDEGDALSFFEDAGAIEVRAVKEGE